MLRYFKKKGNLMTKEIAEEKEFKRTKEIVVNMKENHLYINTICKVMNLTALEVEKIIDNL